MEGGAERGRRLQSLLYARTSHQQYQATITGTEKQKTLFAPTLPCLLCLKNKKKRWGMLWIFPHPTVNLLTFSYFHLQHLPSLDPPHSTSELTWEIWIMVMTILIIQFLRFFCALSARLLLLSTHKEGAERVGGEDEKFSTPNSKKFCSSLCKNIFPVFFASSFLHHEPVSLSSFCCALKPTTRREIIKKGWQNRKWIVDDLLCWFWIKIFQLPSVKLAGIAVAQRHFASVFPGDYVITSIDVSAFLSRSSLPHNKSRMRVTGSDERKLFRMRGGAGMYARRLWMEMDEKAFLSNNPTAHGSSFNKNRCGCH